MEQVRNYGTRAVLGGILIILGGLFLLRSMYIIDFDLPHIIFSGPFVLFVVGILILINSRKKFLGAIFTVVGGVWLLPRIFPEVDIDGGIIVSILIIALGVYIIFKHRRHVDVSQEYKNHENPFEAGNAKNYSKNYSIDFIDEVSVFGGGQRIVHSDNFKGGNVTAIFGGSEINLTNCKLAEGTNIIDVLCIFGGAEINVPRDWQVIVNAVPIFGGFSNKIVRDPNLPIDMSRTLLIKGLAIFGGLEINSKYH